LKEFPKAKCLNCGKELICDQPNVSGGYKFFTSKPHGCPPEFDHTEIAAKDLGFSDSDLDSLFDKSGEKD